MKIKCKPLVITAILSVAGVVMAFQNPTQVNYDEDVTLQGTIKKENGYPMLYLSKGITAIAGPSNDLYSTVKGAKKLQIVWTKEKLPVGCVIVKGQLFGAHTAHHKTEVLIDLKSYKPCDKK